MVCSQISRARPRPRQRGPGSARRPPIRAGANRKAGRDRVRRARPARRRRPGARGAEPRRPPAPTQFRARIERYQGFAPGFPGACRALRRRARLRIGRPPQGQPHCQACEGGRPGSPRGVPIERRGGGPRGPAFSPARSAKASENPGAESILSMACTGFSGLVHRLRSSAITSSIDPRALCAALVAIAGRSQFVAIEPAPGEQTILVGDRLGLQVRLSERGLAGQGLGRARPMQPRGFGPRPFGGEGAAVAVGLRARS